MAQRTLRIDLDLLIALFQEPGDVGRMFTVTRDALPDDAKLVAAFTNSFGIGDIPPIFVDLFLESPRWPDDGTEFVTPMCAVSFDTDRAGG